MIEAVEIRHAQIGDDEVDRLGARDVEPEAAARRAEHAMAHVAQLLDEEVAHRVVVFDDEDGGAVRHRVNLP